MKTTNNIVKYTSRELQSYVDDADSCVRRIADRLHIGLSPAGLGHFKEAVIEAVNRDKVGHFDARLNGIVLDVRNIKVLGNNFHIHTDHPELHIDLLADVYAFRPTVGARIRGVISHIAVGHISVNIHRVFNVAIRLAGGKSKSRTDGLKIGAEITVKVTGFDLKDTIPFIAGELERAPVALRSALKATAGSGAVVAPKATVVGDGEEDDESSDEDDDNRSVLVDRPVRVKSEHRSDGSDSDTSESDADSQNEEHRRAAPQHGNDDDDDANSDDSEASVPLPKVEHIKKEKLSAPPSPSSSSESDSGTEVPARFPTKSVSKADLVASVVAKLAAIIKPEHSGTTASDSPTKRKSIGNSSAASAPKRTRQSLPAASEASDAPKTKSSAGKRSDVHNLLQKMIHRKLSAHIAESDEPAVTPLKSRAARVANANETLANVSAFASPGMSSTMLPEAEATRKVKKSKK